MPQDELFASLLRPHAEALLVEDVTPKVHALPGSLSDTLVTGSQFKVLALRGLGLIRSIRLIRLEPQLQAAAFSATK